MSHKLFLNLLVVSLVFGNQKSFAQTVDQWCSAALGRIAFVSPKPGIVFDREVIRVSIPGREQKNFRVLSDAERGLSIAVPVNDLDEAKAIFQYFTTGALSRWKEGDVLEADGIKGHIVGPEGNNAPGEEKPPEPYFFELRISPINNSLEIRNKFLKLLNQLKSDPSPHGEAVYDLSGASGRREWAFYSSENWANTLSLDEKKCLRRIGSHWYDSLHRYLREEWPQTSDYKKWAKGVDAAIQKNKIDRDITVYRADNRPELIKLWEELNAGTKKPGTPLPLDKAYTFTSLEKNVATWWRRYWLGNKGIIVEIEAPAGSSMAYLDGKDILENRGFQEMVLARQSQFIAQEATTDSAGNRILKVKYAPSTPTEINY